MMSGAEMVRSFFAAKGTVVPKDVSEDACTQLVIAHCRKDAKGSPSSTSKTSLKTSVKSTSDNNSTPDKNSATHKKQLVFDRELSDKEVADQGLKKICVFDGNHIYAKVVGDVATSQASTESSRVIQTKKPAAKKTAKNAVDKELKFRLQRVGRDRRKHTTRGQCTKRMRSAESWSGI